MAQKARKDRAKANAATLNNLHIGTLVLNVLFLLFTFLIRSRSLIAYVVFSLPAFISQYFLENTGRPKYTETGAIKSSGEDLAAQGLTEYMFDIIWVTWGCLLVVMLFGNWGWLLWIVVPAYGAFKGYSLLGMAKGMMGGGQSIGQAPEEQMPMNRKQRRVAA